MSDGLTMTTIDSRENPNAPPDRAQEFTGKAPDSLPGIYNQLPAGAKAFVREYLPEDDDNGAIGAFETVLELKTWKSEQLRNKAVAEGREPGPECEIYEPVVYVRINVRGNDKLEVHRPARKEDKTRFPFAYQEFLKGEESVNRGTPLNRIGIDTAMIRGFHAKNIFTVEDLALVSDNLLMGIGAGARELRQRAIGFVENNKYAKAAASSGDMLEMKATLAEQKKQLDKAMELLQKQAEENEALKAQLVKKKPGRKPKAQEPPVGA